MSLFNIVILTVLMLLMPVRAYAYIDPGTGSMIFQALVAGALGAFFTIKMYWYTLKEKWRQFFSRDKKKSDDAKD